MNHLKAVNRKAARVDRATDARRRRAAAHRRRRSCRTFRSAARWCSRRAGKRIATGGTAGLCQPVERDLFDCHIGCYWPAQVPDQLNHAPDWTEQVRRGPEGLAQDRSHLSVKRG